MKVLFLRKGWKKITKRLKQVLKTLVVVIVVYFVCAVVLAFIPMNKKTAGCNDKKIYLTTNGIHVDIILPRQLLNDSMRHVLNIDEATQYVAFGWGDKAFYLETETWDDFSLEVTVSALFLKSESALHITKYTRQSDKWKYYNVCEEQIAMLHQHLDATFSKDENGKYQYISDGYHSNDSFYAARGSYSCIYTCNNWVGSGLKKAKLRTALWSPLDFGVMRYAGE